MSRNTYNPPGQCAAIVTAQGASISSAQPRHIQATQAVIRDNIGALALVIAHKPAPAVRPLVGSIVQFDSSSAMLRDNQPTRQQIDSGVRALASLASLNQALGVLAAAFDNELRRRVRALSSW